MSKATLTKQQIIDELWRRGELIFKCHAVQQEMHKAFYAAGPNSTLVWLLGRQSGKTFLLSVLALETAIKNKNAIIKFVTDTKVHAKNVVEPLFKKILEDCPAEMAPKYYSQTYSYVFPNGSQIQLAGSDGKHYEKLRGQSATLVLIDEAGFCSDLDNMITSVLLPTTTHTGGKIVLATTPPADMNHPFITFLEEAEMRGLAIKKTIDDNPLLTEEVKKNIEAKMGGRDSEQFRREYLCELIKDSSNTVIPEATDALFKEIVKEWPKPPYFDAYESMDLGFQDLTAVLFGYYDFRADKVIIEDELPFNFKEQDRHLELLTKEIEFKERTLWTNALTNELKEPYLRISDINMIVTNEIRKFSHGRINFNNTKKDDKNSAINTLRVLLANKKIIIHPRCTTLIRHLKNAKWTNNKEKFQRSPDDSHYDFVDALLYMIRHIYFGKNPYPKGYDLDLRREDVFVSKPDEFYKKNDPTNVYKAIFGLNRKRQ